MKLLFILSSLILAHAEVTEENCEGIYFNDIYHEKEVLKEDLDRPYLLAVDYATNTVYFSYSVSEEDEFRTARLNVNTKVFSDIDGINNGFAQTVDRKTNQVYIGSSDGIYKYDYNTNSAELYGAKGEDIWNIFHKDLVYFSTFPSQFLYTYSNGEISRFKDLEDTKVDHFLIDNEDIVFYTNATGLYSQKFGSKNATFYEDFKDNGIRALTTDSKGNIYLCSAEGVFAVKKSEEKVEKVANITEVFGIAFDNSNNLIYSDSSSLVRLVPNRSKQC